MTRRLAVVLACSLAWSAPAAQAPADGCSGDAYRQLDFWVGSWDVGLADGTPVGSNVLERSLRGCALFEHWRDRRGREGKSLFYRPGAGRPWAQVWVTDGGQVKEKRAVEAPAGSMRFQGELPGPDGTPLLDRTTLTPLPDGRVRQLIEQSSDRGASWQAVFDAYYTRRAP